MKRFSLSEIRAMPVEQAAVTCGELRRFLWDNVTQSGGHMASNLGIVEISMALVRVMDLPFDRVIYDTGHQCYVHKILTRAEGAFSTLRSFGGISGFPSRVESEYDAKELTGYLNRFLASLSREDRFLFLRRYWFGDSVRAIAEELGITSHKASVRLFRLRKKLQNYLVKEGMISCTGN